MIIYIDMDNVLCDFSGARKKALEENPLIQFPQSQYGFYQKLIPLDGAIETAMELLHSKKYNP